MLLKIKKVKNAILRLSSTYYSIKFRKFKYRSSSSMPTNFATTLTARAETKQENDQKYEIVHFERQVLFIPGGLRSKLYKILLLPIFMIFNTNQRRVTKSEAGGKLKSEIMFFTDFYSIFFFYFFFIIRTWVLIRRKNKKNSIIIHIDY